MSSIAQPWLSRAKDLFLTKKANLEKSVSIGHWGLSKHTQTTVHSSVGAVIIHGFLSFFERQVASCDNRALDHDSGLPWHSFVRAKEQNSQRNTAGKKGSGSFRPRQTNKTWQ